jgi:hypothetical protein
MSSWVTVILQFIARSRRSVDTRASGSFNHGFGRVGEELERRLR